jgi:hypothetical protein
VLVVAELALHDVEPAFPCCVDCSSQDCRQRIASLASQTLHGGA